MRHTIFLVLLLIGCGTPEQEVPPIPNDPLLSDACRLADETAACPECADGDVTCSYGDVVVTETSCGGCQAANGLFRALCEAGSEATEEELEGRICEDATPAVSATCRLAAEMAGCPECADGDVTCSYGDVVVTEMSCGGCQAEQALLQALCDAGSSATEEELAGLVCEAATPAVSATCRLIDEMGACDECADGDVTCSYGDVVVTEMSCGGCQAEQALFRALCDAGSDATEEELESRVCEAD